MEKDKNKYFTLDDVCRYLDIGRNAVSKLCKLEGFPAFKTDRTYIDKELFFEWVANNIGKTVNLNEINNEKKGTNSVQ